MKSLVFIGGGNMASCIVSGIVQCNNKNLQITVCDPNQDKLEVLREKFGVNISTSNGKAVSEADIVILAVKPQSVRKIILELKNKFKSSVIIISIAAGITTNAIKSWLDSPFAIIRAMPNTPSSILSGATGLYADSTVDNKAKKQVELIFDSIGFSCWIKKESDINAVIALSGSGPAYLFRIFEIMHGVGQELGLEENVAFELLSQTFSGAAKMIYSSEKTATELREQVTSPGGTTERALNIFNNENLEQTFRNAMQEAHDRAEKMSEQFAG
tara:strand:+ start:613 stop:1428 length:816 start_codon:yes stop_codon:yes gene_type:complete